MAKRNNPMDAYMAWARLAGVWGRMSMAAGEVIVRRTAMIARGTMSGPEAAKMMMEKPAAFAEAAQRAAVAAARGGDATRVAAAALRPIGAKAAANARRLRK